jgi:ribosomal protein L4
MKRAGAYDDVKRVIDTKKIKTGKGKLRNKRYS